MRQFHRRGSRCGALAVRNTPSIQSTQDNSRRLFSANPRQRLSRTRTTLRIHPGDLPFHVCPGPSCTYRTTASGLPIRSPSQHHVWLQTSIPVTNFDGTASRTGRGPCRRRISMPRHAAQRVDPPAPLRRKRGRWHVDRWCIRIRLRVRNPVHVLPLPHGTLPLGPALRPLRVARRSVVERRRSAGRGLRALRRHGPQPNAPAPSGDAVDLHRSIAALPQSRGRCWSCRASVRPLMRSPSNSTSRP